MDPRGNVLEDAGRALCEPSRNGAFDAIKSRMACTSALLPCALRAAVRLNGRDLRNQPGHCEPVRTLVWQSVFPIERTTQLHNVKESGLPRRTSAPRNDSGKSTHSRNHPNAVVIVLHFRLACQDLPPRGRCRRMSAEEGMRRELAVEEPTETAGNLAFYASSVSTSAATFPMGEGLDRLNLNVARL